MSSEKIALVTGGTSGIGRETAIRLAQQGYKVTIVGRDATTGKAVAAKIGGDFIEADFSRIAEVRKLAEQFRAKHNRLDLLVHSAGVIHFKPYATPDGFDSNFAINYLSLFFLANSFLDLLKASAPARIVVVSAPGNYPKPKIDFEGVQSVSKQKGMFAVMESSFAKDVFTAELARRLEGTGVTVNSLNPGVVRTNIIRTAGFPFNIMSKLMFPFIASAEKASETPVYLATSNEVAGVSGKYFKNLKQIEVAPLTFDRELGRRLWEVSEKMSGLVSVS